MQESSVVTYREEASTASLRRNSTETYRNSTYDTYDACDTYSTEEVVHANILA